MPTQSKVLASQRRFSYTAFGMHFDGERGIQSNIFRPAKEQKRLCSKVRRKDKARIFALRRTSEPKFRADVFEQIDNSRSGEGTNLV